MLRIVRVALVVQALAMVALLATLLPEFVDRLTRPLDCPPKEWCFDFRGFAFGTYSLVLIPMVSVLVLTVWLWRKKRRWPAILAIVVDLVVIGLGIPDVLPKNQQASIKPAPAAELLLLVLPAVASLAAVVVVLMTTPPGRRAEESSV